jgi:hypothetical protein
MVASGGFRMADGAITAIEGLLEHPLAPVALPPDAAAGALQVVEETYAHHGGFRLRTLQPS